jgi:hypothetical protein
MLRLLLQKKKSRSGKNGKNPMKNEYPGRKLPPGKRKRFGQELRLEQAFVRNKKQTNMSIEKVKRVVAVIKASKLPVAQLIANATHYVQSMTSNVNFPTPDPALSVITAEITALDAANQLALTRVKGSVGKMRTVQKQLITSLNGLAGYVTRISNNDPANAQNILTSSGMAEKKPSVRAPKTFSVKQGALTGTVVLNTKAITRGTYIYQMTTDVNTPASWTTIYIGGKVKFTKTGLTAGTKVYFREANVDKGVQGNYSDAISIVVA